LSLKNFTTLKDSNWINDEIVNAYASLLNRCDGTQALTLNTYVYNDLVRRGGCDYAKVKRILVKNKVKRFNYNK
jgi:Ulp1 family protease